MYKNTNNKIFILHILIIFFLIQPKILYANIDFDCTKINFNKGNEYSIKEFKVEINKNKKWTKNGIKILIDNSRIISEKYKKRYNGFIILKLENNKICKLSARIRQNGDLKDHISLYQNSLRQSLDIHLKEKNIQGITKFKLFLDGTRGISNDEIILTEILREFNFISPRTFKVDVFVNGVKSKMLFQEKTVKEMLEYNNRVESAIFEGNEKLLIKSLEKFANNNLSNDQVGMLSDLQTSIKVLLGRQTNFEWSKKSPIHTKISINALSNLNRSYIQFQNSFNNDFNKYIYYNYNFDNKNLGQNFDKNIIKLDLYNLVLTITNAWHGLSANNRKFYFNKVGNFFEPIYYDGNVNIYQNKNIKLSLPYSDHIEESIIVLEKLLDQIDIDIFKSKLSARALDLTNIQIKAKLDILKFNLSIIKESIKNLDKKIIKLNKEIEFNETMIKNYFDNRQEIAPNTNFIFVKTYSESDIFDFLSCKTLLNCKKIEIDFEKQIKLLSGDSIENDFENVLIGIYSDLKNKTNYKKYIFNEINFYYSDGIDFEINKEEKIINIFQTTPEARAYFINSKIKDFSINFIGNKNFNEVKFLPFDLKGLTGCLSILDSVVENINLSSSNSNCEDSINLVNVEGKISEIQITNSYLDALDLDFSKIDIDKISINKAGNDCLDVSFGIYKVENINLNNCGDKGISVGEKSNFVNNLTNINYSIVGVASKDSSIASFNRLYLNNAKTCLAAYNKKQEFNGGLIKSNFLKCDKFENKFSIDSNSRITIENNVF